MQKFTPYLLAAALTFPGLATADVVLSEEVDTTLGKGVGGWVGVLLGGAAGGPLGALVAGAAGVWAGGEAQDAAGLGGTSYLVKQENGDQIVVRSPRQVWNRGDRVEVVGNRLVAAEVKDDTAVVALSR